MWRLRAMLADWWWRLWRVRCDHWKTCGATDDRYASNWCDHWGEHKPGTMEEEDCHARLCYGHRGREHQETHVRCKRVERSPR